MKKTKLHSLNLQRRAHERGAALITTLLISTLILAAGGALIVSTSTSAVNAIDATAEKQAYYAAEAGLQMALNVLRGNMTHDNTVPAGTRMSFRAAIMPDLSNGTGRNANNNPCGAEPGSGPCRLAAWLPYSNAADPNSMMSVGSSATRVTVFDPDSSNRIVYSTRPVWTPQAGLPAQVINNGFTLRVGAAGNFTDIEYVPQATTTIANAYPSATMPLGSFRISTVNSGAAVAAGSLFAKFSLVVDQSAPWSASNSFSGELRTPVANACVTQAFSMSFTKNSLKAGGTAYAFVAPGGKLDLPCVVANGNGTVAMPQVTITPPEPRHLVVRSLGFGPKFSQKRLELTIDRSSFDFDPPATVLMRSADPAANGTPNNMPAADFDIGNSNAKLYSGNDNSHPGYTASPPLPVFATTNAADTTTIQNVIDNSKPQTVTAAGDKVTTVDNPSLPSWLKDANSARAMLNQLRATAQTMGRYYNTRPNDGITDVEPPDAGTPDNPKFTFVEGDYDMSGDVGGGLLVVTGRVTNNGNVSFSGLILVLGAGEVQRNGGGNGDLLGAWVVAAFDPYTNDAPFTTPFFHTNGGGSNTLQYDSLAVSNAINVFGNSTAGVLEY